MDASNSTDIPLVNTFFKTADSGHWGPGAGWFLFGILLLWDRLGICYILRRRFFEPLGIFVAGLIIAVIHIIVIQKCYSLKLDGPYPRDMCFSRNGAHIGIGLYGTLVGLYECFLQTTWWHHRLGIYAPAKKTQYPYYLASSLFIIVALVMGSHEQSSMWNSMMHQYSGIAAFCLFIIRCGAYTNSRFNLVAGLMGIFGAFIFANASEKAYFYWMQVAPAGSNEFQNFLGFPVSAVFLLLILTILTLGVALLNFVIVFGYQILPEQYKFLASLQSWLMSFGFWDKYLYRLDQIDKSHAYSSQNSVDDRSFDLHLTQRDDVEVETFQEREYAELQLPSQDNFDMFFGLK